MKKTSWCFWRYPWLTSIIFLFLAGEVLFADVLLLPNGMSKVGFYT